MPIQTTGEKQCTNLLYFVSYSAIEMLGCLSGTFTNLRISMAEWHDKGIALFPVILAEYCG